MHPGIRCHLTTQQAGSLVLEMEDVFRREVPSLFQHYLQCGDPWVVLHGTIMFGAVLWPIEERRWRTSPVLSHKRRHWVSKYAN